MSKPKPAAKPAAKKIERDENQNYWEFMAEHRNMTVEEYQLYRIESRLERNRLYGERLAGALRMGHVKDITEQAEDILTAAETLQEVFFKEENTVIIGSFVTALTKAIDAINKQIEELELDSVE
jgi:hypothetical protein